MVVSAIRFSIIISGENLAPELEPEWEPEWECGSEELTHVIVVELV